MQSHAPNPYDDGPACLTCGTVIDAETYFGSGRCAACTPAVRGVPVIALLVARMEAAERRMEDAAEWDTPIRYHRAKAERDETWATIRRLTPRPSPAFASGDSLPGPARVAVNA